MPARRPTAVNLRRLVGRKMRRAQMRGCALGIEKKSLALDLRLSWRRGDIEHFRLLQRNWV
jgi:hypothetical protein